MVKARAEEVENLRRFLRIPKMAAKILAARGLVDPRQAREFLDAKLRQLSNPFLMPGLEAAVICLNGVLKGGESIAVIGDYDVDGISSTSLMVHALRYFGANVRYYIPRRFEEGYGLSQSILDRAFSEGRPDLLIALDCGTNSAREITWARSQGTKVIVIDHHRLNRVLAPDFLLVNPNALPPDETNPMHQIFCTAGLVFKFLHGLLKLRRQEGDPLAQAFNLKGQLDLVTLATVADVVPLIGENRIFVRYGLKELQHPWRVGMRAIMTQAIVDHDRPLIASDLSFRVCPRINASGRIADATLPVEMFLTEDLDRAEAIATQLGEMNAERQRIESEITEEASRIVETQFPDSNSIVLFNDHWHTGVIGIVAGKLMQRYRKPCVVLSREPDAGAKGSGRCVPGLNLVDLLSKCSHLLGSWGGHPLAAGIGMPVENVDRFREAFEVSVTEALKIIDVANDIEISDWIEISDVNESIMKPLRQLEPFGQCNAQPVFAFSNVTFASKPHTFGSHNQHFNFTISDGTRMLHGVAWNRAEDLERVPDRFDLAVRLHSTYWNGNRGIQMEFVDFREANSDHNLDEATDLTHFK